MLKKVDHIGIAVKDLEETLKFLYSFIVFRLSHWSNNKSSTKIPFSLCNSSYKLVTTRDNPPRSKLYATMAILVVFFCNTILIGYFRDKYKT